MTDENNQNTNNLNHPTDENKKRFEVKIRVTPDRGVEKAIFIGGEMLDWQIDINSYVEAVKMGFQYRRAVQRDIEKYFVESVSDFLGRNVTMDDIKEAIKSGWI
jgi:hypothetical protein